VLNGASPDRRTFPYRHIDRSRLNSTTISTASPSDALGLPPAINDSDFNGHFARFVQQLRFAADNEVVLSDPAMFAVPITDEIVESPQAWHEQLPTSSRAGLLLLSILCLPFDPHPREVTTLLDDEAFRLLWPNGRTASLADGASVSLVGTPCAGAGLRSPKLI
jgi:hypothetical protein